MDIAYELAEYIEDNFAHTVGTDLFVGQIPDTTSGITVMRAGGTLGYYLPMEETVVDIYSKYNSATTAIANLEVLKRAMHRMIDTQTLNSKIYSMLVLGDIEDVSRDQQAYKIFKFTLLVKFRDSSLIS